MEPEKATTIDRDGKKIFSQLTNNLNLFCFVMRSLFLFLYSPPSRYEKHAWRRFTVETFGASP